MADDWLDGISSAQLTLDRRGRNTASVADVDVSSALVAVPFVAAIDRSLLDAKIAPQGVNFARDFTCCQSNANSSTFEKLCSHASGQEIKIQPQAAFANFLTLMSPSCARARANS